jgi:hypothetical protein
VNRLDQLEVEGFVCMEGIFDAGAVAGLVDLVERKAATEAGRGGVRNLLGIPEIQQLADGVTLRSLVNAVSGDGAKAVRGILFDKTDAANWKVPWHQDVTIAVQHRVDAEGYGPWSSKAGVLHVQPPAEVLERMLTVRIHLDDCPEENGALRVLAGTHVFGKIPEREVGGFVERSREQVCELKAGGVLLMRPLLLHASSAATQVGRRRVIHLDYAQGYLPAGMGWAVDRRD